MKTGRAFLIALCSAATAFKLTVTSLSAAEAPARPLAPALQEIVKLAKSGVADSITLAYIQSSGLQYALDAQDIIRLGEQGVSSPIITAMMQQAGQTRKTSEATKAAQSNQPAMTTSQPASQPTTAPVVNVVQLTREPVSTVSVTYIGDPRNDYHHPRYYRNGFGALFPTYHSFGWGPRVGFGVGSGGFYGGFSGFGHCR